MTTDTQPIIDVAIQAALYNQPVKATADGREFVYNSQGHPIFLTARPELPDFICGEVVFHEGDSLAEFVNRFKNPNSLMIADITASKLKVKLDYHNKDYVQRNAFTAVWPMPVSEEFRIWSALNGKLVPQEQFLQHLEENYTEIVQPAPTDILTLVRDFQAVKTTEFRAGGNRSNGDKVLLYTEQTQVKGEVVVPKKIVLEMPLYRGEQPIRFEAFFRTRIEEAGLKLGYEFHRIDPIKQAAFRQAVTRVAEAAGMTPLYGVV